MSDDQYAFRLTENESRNIARLTIERSEHSLRSLQAQYDSGCYDDLRARLDVITLLALGKIKRRK